MTVVIRADKFKMLNMVDAGSKYGERTIAPPKTGKDMMQLFKKDWIYSHGAPRFFSAEPEFCHPYFQSFSAVMEFN